MSKKRHICVTEYLLLNFLIVRYLISSRTSFWYHPENPTAVPLPCVSSPVPFSTPNSSWMHYSCDCVYIRVFFVLEFHAKAPPVVVTLQPEVLFFNVRFQRNTSVCFCFLFLSFMIFCDNNQVQNSRNEEHHFAFSISYFVVRSDRHNPFKNNEHLYYTFTAHSCTQRKMILGT